MINGHLYHQMVLVSFLVERIPIIAKSVHWLALNATIDRLLQKKFKDPHERVLLFPVDFMVLHVSYVNN